MQKNVLLFLITLCFPIILLSGCGGDNTDEIVGYWKSDKFTYFWVITENNIVQNKMNFDPKTEFPLYKKDDTWYHELNLGGFKGITAFKMIDKNTIEVYFGNKPSDKSKGIYHRTTEEEIKNILAKKKF